MSSWESTSSLRSLARRPCRLLKSRSVAMTLAPSSANFSAMARPMPWPAAVTSATFPCTLPLMTALMPSVRSTPRDLFAAGLHYRNSPARASARRPSFADGHSVSQHGEPGVVAIAALDDHVLADRSLRKRSPSAVRRGAKRRYGRRISIRSADSPGSRTCNGREVLRFGASGVRCSAGSRARARPR